MPRCARSLCRCALLAVATASASFPQAAAITLTSLTPRTVLQRDHANFATFAISGAFSESATAIEARAVVRSGFGGTTTPWQVIDAAPAGGAYAGTLTASGGWYDVEVRAMNGALAVGSAAVERIGVGEVFITAGQSNSANEGADGPLSPADDRVSAYGPATGWRAANDPQPVATGTRGSPWPSLGDQLAARYDVPIGFYSVGWSGTAVEHWLPGAVPIGPTPLYDRIKSAINRFGADGVRAVLWHQGETDNIFNTPAAVYASRLQTVIDQSRLDAGYDLPWLVALASSFLTLNGDANVIAGQQQVIDDDPLTYLGPNTDALTGSPWRDTGGAGVHFSTIGLIEHARLWAVAIDDSGLIPPVPEPSAIALAIISLAALLPLGHRRRRHPAG